MLLGNPPRPRTREKMLQRLGFTDPVERIAKHGLDKIQDPQGDLTIDLDPSTQVLAKLCVEDWFSRGVGRGRLRRLTVPGQGRTLA